jgi:hypothetical protein
MRQSVDADETRDAPYCSMSNWSIIAMSKPVLSVSTTKRWNAGGIRVSVSLRPGQIRL